jgi:hypothetical protein
MDAATLGRLIDERDALAVKLAQLTAFFENKDFYALGANQRRLLGRQARAMQEYLETLNERITLA